MDLKRAAKLLDDFPNVNVEVGAILYDLGRQPRAAREFFIKYQNRILFGKDAFEPTEVRAHWSALRLFLRLVSDDAACDPCGIC